MNARADILDMKVQAATLVELVKPNHTTLLVLSFIAWQVPRYAKSD